MIAVVDKLNSDGTASSNAALGGTTSDYSRVRDALLNRHQLLYSDSTNALRLALPGLDHWIAGRTDQAPNRSPQHGRAEQSSVQPSVLSWRRMGRYTRTVLVPAWSG